MQWDGIAVDDSNNLLLWGKEGKIMIIILRLNVSIKIQYNIL